MRISEFNNPKKEFVEIFKKFLPLAMKIIGLKSLPKIVFEKEVYSPDQPTFGQYVNDEHILYVGLSNRHPNDILRTLAHELVHYKQDIEHKLNDMSGATGSPEENQANSVAGIVMRMFNKKYPEYLKVKPFMFENVDLDQTLFEGPSLPSTLRSIITNGEPIAQLYERLKAMAKNWMHNNGQLKGFHRNAAGQTARWFNDFYFNKLQNELYSLAQQTPKHSGPLKSFLKDTTENREKHITFAEISEKLPSILFNIGKNINDDGLMRFAKNWELRKKEYEEYLAKIESEDSNNNDTEIDDQPRDNFLGRQNAQVEEIVNNILRNLPNRVAGEIRNAIARSPNKLQALQQELARRNIQGLEETIRKVKGDYRLISRKGKNLGTYPTKAGAEKRERQVQYFKHLGVAEATGDEKFDRSMRQMTGKITPDDAAKMWPTQEFEPIDLDPSYLPTMEKYKAKLFPMAYQFWTDGDNADELRALGWEPDYGDDYVMVILSGIGHDGHIQYDKYDFDAKDDEQGVAENFANGRNPQDKGDSARHGIRKGMTIAQLKKIRSSKTASPRKKQLAHWQINMRQGRNK